MSIEYMVILKTIVRIVLSVLFMVILLKINWKENVSKVGETGTDFVGKALKKSKINYFNFESIQRFLNTKGANYLFGENAGLACFREFLADTEGGAQNE